MKLPYLIWAPLMSKRGGTKVLHRLAKLLRDRGYPATLSCDVGSEADAKRIAATAITVYPEVISGNPFQSPRVVHYDLAPCRNVYPKGDVVFLYDPMFESSAPKENVLMLHTIEPFFSPNPVINRSRNCFYFGKVHDHRSPISLAGMTEIHYSFPETREQLARLLKETDILYCFDGLTILVMEANLCGTVVVKMPPFVYTEEKHESEYWAKNYGVAWWKGDQTDIAKARETLPLARVAYEQQQARIPQQMGHFIQVTQGAFA